MDIKKLSDDCQCVNCRFKKAPTMAEKVEAARTMLAQAWRVGAEPRVVERVEGFLAEEAKDMSYLEGGIAGLKYAATGMLEKGLDPAGAHLDSMLAAFLRTWLRRAGEDLGELRDEERELRDMFRALGMEALVMEDGKVRRLGERRDEVEWPDEVEGA